MKTTIQTDDPEEMNQLISWLSESRLFPKISLSASLDELRTILQKNSQINPSELFGVWVNQTCTQEDLIKHL
ncbi:hypothetical protein J2I47_13660 [Fibrella sp. HMF5335]|uniref:Uncharacterized protein n=1 Tax=Fibrella rubiginis TaxID=2817060 RepID=A0A939K5C1_9BACT|nr:hypothetical protein [Fibrella rubiginis]MBO0937598.1 hypothetical protein [Fibrella rubiginis]